MKNVFIASALALAFAAPVAAQDMFAVMSMDEDRGTSRIDIEPFNASGDGFIALYDYRGGVTGELLGVASFVEGANATTNVTVGRGLRNDVIALMFIGDDFSDPAKAVDQFVIDVQ